MREKKDYHAIGKSFVRLVQIAATLRGEQGCVWDKEQTISSLKPFLLEECYEVVAAIDEENDEEIKEELGDLLYQVIFLGQIFFEHQKFDIEEVIDTICAKLIRRHPHVFGDERASTSKEVLARWEEIKKEEGKDSPKSILDGVPHQLPGLMKAHRIQEKASRVGFDWSDATEVLAKVREEIGELEEVLACNQAVRIEAELGDLFFALVNFSRFVHIDPERALNRTIRRFISRFTFLERRAREEGKVLSEMSLQEMDTWWEEAKRVENSLEFENKI